jgi:outer membrane lipoprotein-sorting protein
VSCRLRVEDVRVFYDVTESTEEVAMRGLMFGSLAVALVLGCVPLACAQEEVKAILEKAVKAHGGAEKLNKMKCLQSKSKGKLELFGSSIDMTQEVSIKFAGKFREVAELDVNGQKVKVISVFDGSKASIMANGQPVDVTDKIMEEFKEGAHAMKVGRLTNLLTDKSLQLSLLGESKVEGRPAVGVKIASKGHRDIDLYFDKESGMLVKVQTRKNDLQTMQEVDEERIIKEYQEVDGQKVPKKVLVNHEGKKYLELEVFEVKFPDDIDDSEFQKP